MRISDWSSDVCSSDLLGDPGIGAVLSNWHDYRPDRPFDAIISVGAFEHFAHPQQSVEERRGVYREFFQACRDWMAGKGRLSLQTIAYGRMSPCDANPFLATEISPAGALPTLGANETGIEGSGAGGC